MSKYIERFWKASWDDRLKDLDPKLWDATVPEAFKDTLLNYSDKVAFSFQNKETSFGEIEKISNQFANMLIENGFGKGDIVGINLPNIPEYLISVVLPFGKMKSPLMS